MLVARRGTIVLHEAFGVRTMRTSSRRSNPIPSFRSPHAQADDGAIVMCLVEDGPSGSIARSSTMSPSSTSRRAMAGRGNGR